MKKLFLMLTAGVLIASCSSTQVPNKSQAKSDNPYYWQQHVNYDMDVKMDVSRYQYDGKQTLVYTNNSPETLDRVYYHLFYNAFQPGSEMDVRSRTIKDPDGRVGSRIVALNPSEQGFLHVKNMTQDGKSLSPMEEGTILIVPLAQALKPGQSTTFELDFNGQLPVQIRRSGRNNAEGVALSMSQWYPKMAEFDKDGWNASQYIGREFHGVWGDFDVKITLDKEYTIGGTGYLQNSKEIGHGYDTPNSGPGKGENGMLTWHFKAPMVHDFVWAADPNYIHDIYKGANNVDLHFFYKDNAAIKDNWKKLQPATNQMLEFYDKHIGQYPYKQYSVIQGGDGGMEYAMATLITGERSFGSLAGVTAHEFAHSWFNHILATNELKYEWMDEGFTSYISDEAMNSVFKENKENPSAGSYNGYIRLATSGIEQPQTTHADRYALNAAYGTSAYSKGAVFLAQLGYIVGDDVRDQIIKQYFDTWKFKHPAPNDFKRVAERVSKFELEWYLTDWTRTTNTIDYAIDGLKNEGGVATVSLSRKGLMPMPLDIQVMLKDGSSKMYYVPLEMMYNQKKVPTNWTVEKDWAWAYPTYQFALDGINAADVDSITIDPKNRMADINKENNLLTQ